MQLKKVVDAFNTWWLKPSVPSTYTYVETFHSPSSLAMNNRKEAARLAFIEGYKMGVEETREIDSWVKELKDNGSR